DEQLRRWCVQLADALELDGVEVDLGLVLGLAGRAAHAVLRPAAPLTTFLVGYAAAQRAANPGTSVTEAVAQATETADRLCRAEQAHAEQAHAEQDR
ncbi:MAG: DUF6457 domain-containing protein, partial [Mycobacteriaceae bacterium]